MRAEVSVDSGGESVVVSGRHGARCKDPVVIRHDDDDERETSVRESERSTWKICRPPSFNRSLERDRLTLLLFIVLTYSITDVICKAALCQFITILYTYVYSVIDTFVPWM